MLRTYSKSCHFEVMPTLLCGLGRPVRHSCLIPAAEPERVMSSLVLCQSPDENLQNEDVRFGTKDKITSEDITNTSCNAADESAPRVVRSSGRRTRHLHSKEKQNSVCDDSNSKPKNVHFSSVTVYSFTREQGFTSIPDTGWCSLGMSRKHCSVSRYDIHHHQLLQRLRRRRRFLSQKHRITSGSTSLAIRLRGKGRMAKKGKHFVPEAIRISPGDSCRVPVFSSPPPLSPQMLNDRPPFLEVSADPTAYQSDSVEATPPPPCLSPPSPRRVLGNLDESLLNATPFLCPDGFDTDSETSLDQMPSVSAVQSTKVRHNRRKLLPIHGAARIRILRESGVTRLDESEREICLRVRATRSCVGCNCGPRYPCSPSRCSCAEEGVQCQVDRASFPCSCTAEQCHNPYGRTEFSHERVRAYVHRVLSRLASDSDITSTLGANANQPEPGPSGDAPDIFRESNPLEPIIGVMEKPLANEQFPSQPSVSRDKAGAVNSLPTVNAPSSAVPSTNSTVFITSKLISSAHPVVSLSPSLSRVCDPYWISSTPALTENSVRRVLFEEPIVTPVDLKQPDSSKKLPDSVANHPLVYTEVKPDSKCLTRPADMKQSSVAHKPATPSLKRTKIGGTPLRSSCRPSTVIASQQCSEKADSQKNNNLAPEVVPEIVSISSLRLLVPPTETVKDTEGSSKVTSLPQTYSDALTTQPVKIQHVPEFPGTPTTANDAEDHPPLSSNIPLIDAPAPTRTPLPAGCNLSDVIATPLRSRAPVRRMIRTRKLSKGLFMDTCESAPPQSPTRPGALWPHFLHADLKLAVNRAANSAPNSPGVDGFSSFGRLSLRRRAIPRLPVTPSRRVLRTPNARLTPRKVTPKARTPICSKPQVMEPDTVKNSHMSFPTSPVNSACDPSNTQSLTSSQQVFSDSDKQPISPRPPPPDTTSCPTIPVSVPFPE